MKLLFGLLSLFLIGVRSEWYGPYDYPFESLEPARDPRLLNIFNKGWKSGHPLTEFGKIHIIKKGWGKEKGHGHGHAQPSYGYGWGTYGDSHEEDHGSHGHGHGHGHGGGGGHGWGWGGHGHTQHVHHHTVGWKEPEKKGWFTFPKKSFGIHVKGGVGFSFGGKKGGQKHTTTTHVSPGWGQRYGWGWNGWNGWQPQRHHEGGHHERTLPLTDQTNKLSSGGRSLEIEDDYELVEDLENPSYRIDETVFGTGDLGQEIVDYVYAPGYNYYQDY